MTPELHTMLRAWLADGDESQRRHAEHRLSLPDAVGYVPSVPAPAARPQAGRALAPPLDPWRIVTADQLARDTLALVAELPPDIDLVCAVSRSGLMPGGLIASMLHLPMWTVSSRHELMDPGHGFRMVGRASGAPRHILLIDDTAAHGVEMRGCPPKILARWPDARITRAVIYCAPPVQHTVDLYYALYPGSHYLEWNWQNAGHAELMGVDFDGILCQDPPYEGEPPPLYLPRRNPVTLIVSGRHESSRAHCNDWLARHGVRYEEMLLRGWDFDPTIDEATQIGTWKGDIVKGTSLKLYAESDPYQAEIINRISGKPVLCPSLGRVLPPIAIAGPAPKRGCCH